MITITRTHRLGNHEVSYSVSADDEFQAVGGMAKLIEVIDPPSAVASSNHVDSADDEESFEDAAKIASRVAVARAATCGEDGRVCAIMGAWREYGLKIGRVTGIRSDASLKKAVEHAT